MSSVHTSGVCTSTSESYLAVCSSPGVMAASWMAVSLPQSVFSGSLETVVTPTGCSLRWRLTVAPHNVGQALSVQAQCASDLRPMISKLKSFLIL